MVGSFAAGLSEGLTKGWVLGKDIQDSVYEEERRAAARKARGETGGGGSLPPIKDMGAKPPSPTEPDPTGTGTSGTGGGEPFDPNSPAATTPAKIEGGKVVKPAAQPAALLPPGAGRPTTMPDGSASMSVPAPATAATPSAAGPVVAQAAIPPAAGAVPQTALGGGALSSGSPFNRWVGSAVQSLTPNVGFSVDRGLYPSDTQHDPEYAREQPTPSPLPPQRGVGTVLPSRSALPSPLPRQSTRPPYQPGVGLFPGSTVGGALPGAAPPPSPTSPVFTAPIPSPPPSDAPPGATQGPDGKWYAPSAAGGWMPVVR